MRSGPDLCTYECLSTSSLPFPLALSLSHSLINPICIVLLVFCHEMFHSICPTSATSPNSCRTDRISIWLTLRYISQAFVESMQKPSRLSKALLRLSLSLYLPRYAWINQQSHPTYPDEGLTTFCQM